MNCSTVVNMLDWIKANHPVSYECLASSAWIEELKKQANDSKKSM